MSSLLQRKKKQKKQALVHTRGWFCLFCFFFKDKTRNEDFKLQECHSITLEILRHIIQVSDTWIAYFCMRGTWNYGCFSYCPCRLISHPSTFINQGGKFLWSHCNKDSPVISFIDTCRHTHSRNQCSPNTQIQLNKKSFISYAFILPVIKKGFSGESVQSSVFLFQNLHLDISKCCYLPTRCQQSTH